MTRSFGKPMRILLTVVAVIVIAVIGYAAIWLPNRPGDTSHTRVVFNGTGSFSERQLDDAVRLLKERGRSFTGCAIDDITYDAARSSDDLRVEKTSVEDHPGSGSAIYSNGIAIYGMDHMAVFHTDFTCGGMNPPFGKGQNSISDYLAYAPDDPKSEYGWRYIDGGNG